MRQRPLNQAERAEHAGDNPALSDVIERNIRTIIQLRLRAARARGVQDRLADAITAFSGRMVFVYAHIVWFGLWFLLNTGRFGVLPFDPFPYGLLTMVVSLEKKSRIKVHIRPSLHIHVRLFQRHLQRHQYTSIHCCGNAE